MTERIMQTWARIEFRETHDHAGSQGIVIWTHPQNGAYQVRILKWYHAAGCIVSANAEQMDQLPNPIPDMIPHYEDGPYEEAPYGEPEKPHPGIAKKGIALAVAAVVLAMGIAYATKNYGGKHNASMAKVESINARNLELVNERDSQRTRRDEAKKQMDAANAEIATVENELRKNKSEISAILKTVYE